MDTKRQMTQEQKELCGAILDRFGNYAGGHLLEALISVGTYKNKYANTPFTVIRGKLWMPTQTIS